MHVLVTTLTTITCILMTTSMHDGYENFLTTELHTYGELNTQVFSVTKISCYSYIHNTIVYTCRQ